MRGDFLNSRKPESLRSNDLYCFIMQYLALNTGKIVTPSLITTTINKCLGVQYTTNKTVSNYLEKIKEAGLVYEIDREYITTSNNEPNKLGYNRTYYFSDFDLFKEFYDSALGEVFKHQEIDGLSHDIAVAKMVFYHKSINAGYKVKSGVLSYFSHLDSGKTKKNTFSFDFILENDKNKIYVVFQNSKDFNEDEFTIESKFALQNIINDFSILVVTTCSSFKVLEIDGFRYVGIGDILSDKFEILKIMG